jgi:hypothetical protein
MKTENKIILSFAATVLFFILISFTRYSDKNAYYGKMQAKINALQSVLKNEVVVNSVSKKVNKSPNALCNNCAAMHSYFNAVITCKKLHYQTWSKV